MNGMRIRFWALLGWGIVIYALMFLLWSVFVTYGFVEGLLPRVIGFLVLVALGIIAGRALRVHTWRDALPYSLSWGIMMAVFDTVLTAPFTGWHLFFGWSVWLGYATIVIAPLLAFYPIVERFLARLPRV